MGKNVHLSGVLGGLEARGGAKVAAKVGAKVGAKVERALVACAHPTEKSFQNSCRNGVSFHGVKTVWRLCCVFLMWPLMGNKLGKSENKKGTNNYIKRCGKHFKKYRHTSLKVKENIPKSIGKHPYQSWENI